MSLGHEDSILKLFVTLVAGLRYQGISAGPSRDRCVSRGRTPYLKVEIGDYHKSLAFRFYVGMADGYIHESP
jgi:hypothetical protein